ncbi:MAG TPA: hypothetical protein VK249_15580 [Anaerolineales bacterium]|nr:hypothetical protein [Anaerolineales bacterium]
MSKPIARVAFFVLISLVLIAATYFTVQAALPGAGASAQVHIVNGLQTNLNHYRVSISDQANSANAMDDMQMNGGCHNKGMSGPDD